MKFGFLGRGQQVLDSGMPCDQIKVEA